MTITPGTTTANGTAIATVSIVSGGAALAAAGTITVDFGAATTPASYGFQISPTASTSVVLGTGFTGCTATVATTVATGIAVVTLADAAGSTCASTPAGSSFTISGVTNPGAGTYASSVATNVSGVLAVKTSVDATAYVGAASVKISGALNVPVATSIGSGSVNVSFPADEGISWRVSNVDYTNAANGGTQTCVVAYATAPGSGSNQSCSITGLTNGDQYYFYVTPINDGLNSPANTISLKSALTTVNSSLLKVSAYNAGYDTAGTDEAWVSFTADGVGVLYTVTGGGSGCIYGNSSTAATGTVGCKVTGLTNGTSYTFTVTPNVADTASVATAASAITANHTTSGTAAAVAGGNATVTFATDGVATTYVVDAANGDTCTVVQAVPAIGLASCTIASGDMTGTYGTGGTHAISITPSGGGTTASPGVVTNKITASTALGTPTVAAGPNSVYGTASVVVSFTADGAATTYTVASLDVTTNTANASACLVANSATPPSGAQTCTVVGLTAGHTYQFNVTPSGNPYDTTTVSAYSSQITTGNVKFPTPTVDPLHPHLGYATVSFTEDIYATQYVVTAYAYDPISGLNASASSGTCTVILAAAPLTPTTGSCNVAPLTAGKKYDFTITPSGGTETLVTSSMTTTHEPVLGASLGTPTVAAATPTSTGAAATVTFTADGAAAFYVVTANDTTTAANGWPGDTTATCTVANTTTAPTGTQSCTIYGLTTNDAYTFTVTPDASTSASVAATSASWTASVSVSVTGFGFAASGALKVTWIADGKATAYTATAYTAGPTPTKTCIVSSTTAIPAGPTSCTITGLTNGVAYQELVTPSGGYQTTAGGAFTAGATALFYIAGTAPLATPTLTWAADGALKATFAADGVANFYTVYLVEATPVLAGQGLGANLTCNVGSSTTVPTGTQSCTITGLTDGNTYVAYVSAVGNGTTSASSGISAIPVMATQYSAPGAPVVTATALTSTTVSVAFTAPVVTGGSVIGGYLISGTSTDGTSSLVCGAGALTAGTVVCTGAKPGTTYKISVYAAGPFGVSAAGTASVTTPAATLLTVGASFTKGTAKLTASAKSALTTLVSSLHDGASITIRGWGATKALATARANAVASFIMSSGAAVHTTVIGIVSKASDAKVYQTA